MDLPPGINTRSLLRSNIHANSGIIWANTALCGASPGSFPLRDVGNSRCLFSMPAACVGDPRFPKQAGLEEPESAVDLRSPHEFCILETPPLSLSLSLSFSLSFSSARSPTSLFLILCLHVSRFPALRSRVFAYLVRTRLFKGLLG